MSDDHCVMMTLIITIGLLLGGVMLSARSCNAIDTCLKSANADKSLCEKVIQDQFPNKEPK